MLIDTLRGDLLEEISLMSDRMDTAAVVKILQSLESVADHVNDDPSHKFSARFLGSAGLEALVEVAHDMRSPLASIVLLVETMRQGQSGPVNAVQERQLALVYGATFGLSLMANDVIDLARGDERSLEGTQMPFSIHDVMLAVKDIVQPIAEEKGLELRLEPPPSDWRRGRPSVLQRVLLNLTTNALKFTDEGFVIVSARQISRTGVEFSVIDSGRGIPAHLQDTVFDAFRQNEAGGKTTFSSSGLGLAICRKLVRAMGGEMVAENLDRGSRFHFTIDLPLASRF
jgi:signal transduction histidine kinase